MRLHSLQILLIKLYGGMGTKFEITVEIVEAAYAWI